MKAHVKQGPVVRRSVAGNARLGKQYTVHIQYVGKNLLSRSYVEFKRRRRRRKKM